MERYLKCRGPITPYEIANRTGWSVDDVTAHLDALVATGKAVRGVYTVEKGQPQYVNRVNLEEIHRLTLRYLRRELSACAPHEVVDFMTRWQHVHPETRLDGVNGLREVIGQLQGYEAVTGAIEPELLANRVTDYAPEMLDKLLASGEVCWRRIGVDRVVRGKLTLCLRRDAALLGAGAPVAFDVAGAADADIRAEILTVRDFFRQHRTAFFDDLLAATGVAEAPATRAVWYLVWAGELSCDTYECVRHAHFQVTLSACYDLDSTPRKILNGRVSPARVLKQMRKRRLDPRLGRWIATERLAAAPADDDARTGEEQSALAVSFWAGQLLRRWGIVTRDMLAAETGAPSWSALMPEFKRLELLGQVQRGYFIESHHGEQYGLPDAVELLRDCRARRSDGHELGYLPDEPIFALTSRDPANLYAASLDVIDERGEVLKRAARKGNFVHRVVLQAGQALVVKSQQTVTLTREQLERCIAALVRTCATPNLQLTFYGWNGYPLVASPVAPLLQAAGCRLDTRGNMTYPPRTRASREPEARPQDVYLPYFAEPNPVQYGREWTLRLATDALRPALGRLLDAMVPELEKRGWDVVWNADGIGGAYRKEGRAHVRIARSFLQVNFRARSFRDKDGTRHHMPAWHCHAGMRITCEEDVGEAFVHAFRNLLKRAEWLTDRYFELRRR